VKKTPRHYEGNSPDAAEAEGSAPGVFGEKAKCSEIPREFSASLRDGDSGLPVSTKLTVNASIRMSAGMLDVFGEEGIHVVADAVAERVTDFPHTVKSGDQAITAVRG
jgi:hypothetical protein